MSVEQSSTLWKQQTPKPDAQFPETDPPFSVHSSAVLQIPFIEVSMVVVHSSFGKVTTENREKDFEDFSSDGMAEATDAKVNKPTMPFI